MSGQGGALSEVCYGTDGETPCNNCFDLGVPCRADVDGLIANRIATLAAQQPSRPDPAATQVPQGTEHGRPRKHRRISSPSEERGRPRRRLETSSSDVERERRRSQRRSPSPDFGVRPRLPAWRMGKPDFRNELPHPRGPTDFHYGRLDPPAWAKPSTRRQRRDSSQSTATTRDVGGDTPPTPTPTFPR
jgi:hypothetical protein